MGPLTKFSERFNINVRFLETHWVQATPLFSYFRSNADAIREMRTESHKPLLRRSLPSNGLAQDALDRVQQEK